LICDKDSWKSRRRCGRPNGAVGNSPADPRDGLANPLWGAPRIHGELLKLGIEIGQTSVTKYMARRRAPPSQGWKTFLRNHADGIAAMDLFVVPKISFRLLYGVLIMGHGASHYTVRLHKLRVLAKGAQGRQQGHTHRRKHGIKSHRVFESVLRNSAGGSGMTRVNFGLAAGRVIV
jgi:hypothetical protein